MEQILDKQELFGIEVVGEPNEYEKGNLFVFRFGDYCNVGGGRYVGVITRHEHFAIDMLIDYCAKHHSNWMESEDRIAELRRDALDVGYDEDIFLLEEAVCGGNASEYLYVGYGMTVEQF